MGDLREGEQTQAVSLWGLDGNVVSTRVTLTSAGTAYQLPSSPLDKRKAIMIYNGTGQTVYLGPGGVTSSTGFPITNGSYTSLDIGKAALYAVCSTAGVEVAIIEIE